LLEKLFIFKGLFVSTDCGRIDSREDRKFMENCDSIVWFACLRGKKVYFVWTPSLKNFPRRIEKNVGREGFGRL